MMPFSGVPNKSNTIENKEDEVKRVLFCATVDFHFEKFHLPTLSWFQEQGWEVHVAAAGDLTLPYVDKKHKLAINRSPFRTVNLKAYRELEKLIREYSFDLIHCHTPMGGVLTRLAAQKSRKKGTKVFYTAHGFHFCKGSPLLNWLVYYPIEKGLARWTDCLITINEEDYSRAKNHHFKAKQIVKINGVGVNTRIFKPISEKEKQFLRASYGFQTEDVLLFYAAEFNKNKNQQILIYTLAELREEFPQAKLLLAGNGPLLNTSRELASQLGVQDQIKFLGYQDNVLPYLQMSDLAVASSLREGLPVNILEAMACGLPIVATDNRGHRELVVENQNGYLINGSYSKLFADRLKRLIEDSRLRKQLGLNGKDRIDQRFSLTKVMEELLTHYSGYLGKEVEKNGEPNKSFTCGC
jgi:glycosyltransferase EpsD